MVRVNHNLSYLRNKTPIAAAIGSSTFQVHIFVHFSVLNAAIVVFDKLIVLASVH